MNRKMIARELNLRSFHVRRASPVCQAAIAAVVMIVLVIVGAYLVVKPDSPPQSAPVQPTLVADQPQSWCYVQSECHNYPNPAGVQGITIAALENYLLFTRSVKAQIRAATGWNVNTVRLQIVQDKLVGPNGNLYSPGYMHNIEQIVNYALQRHLFVVLNAQTEISMGFPQNENMPTAATNSFWKHMTEVYGHNPRVVFDLFNEPRNTTWSDWESEMQNLVNYVRKRGADNELWVEGLWWGSTFAEMPKLLQGRGLVYSFHHPGGPWPWQGYVPGYKPGINGPPLWDRAFGYLHVPMVNGEFVNYRGGYYWPHSTQMVAEYLRYLRDHHIGMVAWSLQPGIMTATSALGSAVSEPQGAGRLVWRYFHHLTLPPAPYQVVYAARRFGR